MRHCWGAWTGESPQDLGPDGPRIIDFGVARTANASSLTTVNALIGTYGYMAPEQLGRKEVTFGSDLARAV